MYCEYEIRDLEKVLYSVKIKKVQVGKQPLSTKLGIVLIDDRDNVLMIKAQRGGVKGYATIDSAAKELSRLGIEEFVVNSQGLFSDL